MIAFIDDVEQSLWPQALNYRAQLVGGSKRIPRTLNEKHRHPDSSQMLGPQLFRPPRRMKRIAQEYEAAWPLNARGGNLRRDSAAHRLSPDYQPRAGKLGSLPDRFNHSLETGFEFFGAIWDLPAVLGVGKIECRRVTPSGCQAFGKLNHETAGLRRARSMPEDHRDRCSTCRGPINEAGYAASVGHLYLNLHRHRSHLQVRIRIAPTGSLVHLESASLDFPFRTLGTLETL